MTLQLHLPGRVELHPLVRQRRPGDGATQLFQPLAVMGLDSHRLLGEVRSAFQLTRKSRQSPFAANSGRSGLPYG